MIETKNRLLNELQEIIALLNYNLNNMDKIRFHIFIRE